MCLDHRAEQPSRPNVRGLGPARPQILPDLAHGADGQTRGHLEALGLCGLRSQARVDHHDLHRLPGPGLLLLPHLPRRERRERENSQFRRRPLVGSGEFVSEFVGNPICIWLPPRIDHIVHRRLRRYGSLHVAGKNYRLLLRPPRHLIFRTSRRKLKNFFRNVTSSVIPCFIGYFGLRVRVEGSTAATAKAHDPQKGSRGHAHPMFVEVLRRGWKLLLGSHVENTSNPSKIAAAVSKANFFLFLIQSRLSNDIKKEIE